MKHTLYEPSHDLSDKFYYAHDKTVDCAAHFHRNIELLYIVSGSTRTDVDGKICIAEKDDLIFVNHYYRHHMATITAGTKMVLIVPPEYSIDFDLALKNKPLPSIMSNKTVNLKIKSLFNQISIIFKSKQPEEIKKILYKGAINTIIGTLLSSYEGQSPPSSTNSKLISDILFYIDNNYTQKLTLDILADYFGYNKFYFSKLWNANISKSLSSYINILRAQKAAEKMRDGTVKNISDVAYDCGFDSLTTFYRYYNALYETKPKKSISKP